MWLMWVQTAYDWPSLPANSVVVEVGGGMGTSAFPLASRFPDLVLVVQDLPSVIAKAEKVYTLASAFLGSS